MKENQAKKILTCCYIIIILLVLNTVIVICKGNISNTSNNNTTETTNEYDVSMMESVDLKTMIDDVFKRDEVQVVYMGRSTCGHCVSFLPTLQKAQKELGYKTVYIDIEKVDTDSDEYKTFIKKLDKDYTMTVNGEEVTDTYGTFYGYTPAVFLVKDNKMVDGKIGELDYDDLIDWLKDNNVK